MSSLDIWYIGIDRSRGLFAGSLPALTERMKLSSSKAGCFRPS